MSELYDVTVTMRPGMPTFDGEPGPSVTPLSQIERGDPANVSLVSFGVHTGTHVDAPVHFLDGTDGVEALDVEAMIGPAVVLDAGRADAVGRAELEAAGLPDPVERLLLKTRNSSYWNDDQFHRDFVYLAIDGARWLLERGIRLVGIDYLSIERYGSTDYAVHKALLAAGVVIVEGLDFRGVPPGPYQVACLPAKLQGADGAPARVVLWR